MPGTFIMMSSEQFSRQTLPLTQCANILQNITKTYPHIFMVIFLKVDTLFNI